MCLVTFESTFFVVTKERDKMELYTHFLIIPYKAIDTIEESEWYIYIQLCKNYNLDVKFDRDIYLIEEGKKFQLRFESETERKIFLENYHRYKNLTKNDN